MNCLVSRNEKVKVGGKRDCKARRYFYCTSFRLWWSKEFIFHDVCWQFSVDKVSQVEGKEVKPTVDKLFMWPWRSDKFRRIFLGSGRCSGKFHGSSFVETAEVPFDDLWMRCDMLLASIYGWKSSPNPFLPLQAQILWMMMHLPSPETTSRWSLILVHAINPHMRCIIHSNVNATFYINEHIFVEQISFRSNIHYSYE